MSQRGDNMLCPKCGASLPEGTAFCYSCGERQPESQPKENNAENQQNQYQQTNQQTDQQYNYQQYQYQQHQQSQQQYQQNYQFSPFDNGAIIFSFKRMVDSVFVLSLISLAFAGGLIGLICGIIALRRIPKIISPQIYGNSWEMQELENGKSRLKTSKILAIIGVVLSVILLIVEFIYFYAVAAGIIPPIV
jgi:hypothetical protein